MLLSVLRQQVSNDPVAFEARKSRLKRMLPISDAHTSRLSHTIGKLHQRYFEDFVFIHISKCGGTSMERALGVPLLNHDTALERLNWLGPKKWERRFKFALVRNPFDRIASLYLYWQRDRPYSRDDLLDGWHPWLNRLSNRLSLGQIDRHTMPQWDWVSDGDGTLILDRVYKLEDIAAAERDLAERLGRQITMRRVKRQAQPVDSRELLTPRARAQIVELYADDFEKLDYAKA